MVVKIDKANTKSIKWLGYCIECEKWRNNHHTLTHVETGQKRCGICASVVLIVCPVCNGDGQVKEGGVERYCDHCGGHRVVPQNPVGDKK